MKESDYGPALLVIDMHVGFYFCSERQLTKDGELPKLIAKAATASIEMDEETIIISKRTENCLLKNAFQKIKKL